MSKKFKGIQKFFVNKKVCFIMIIVSIIAAAVWYVCYTDAQNISIQASLSEYNEIEYKKMMTKKTNLDTACNVTLTLLSISFSSLLTALFIEKTEKNNIINDVMVHDLFTSKYFIDKLDENEFNNLLVTLEKKKYFSESKAKADMYSAIRKKLNNAPLDNKPLYYEKCFFDIKCKEHKDYIEKEILKTISIRSTNDKFKDKKFRLVSITSCIMEGIKTSEIKSFKINDRNIDLKYIKPESFNVDNMDIKQGYKQGVRYYYEEGIEFSKNYSVNIEIQYITRTPIENVSYSCRLPYPCRNLDFKFSLESDNFSINPIAFGFIDDAKKSPNRPEDRKNVTINFDDWIFPLDGICIFLEKTLENHLRI